MGVSQQIRLVRTGPGTSDMQTVYGWILFRPEALSLKGLGTLTTLDSYTFAMVSSKPLRFPCATPPHASSLGCEQIVLEVMFSKCSASYLQQLKRDLLVEAVWC